MRLTFFTDYGMRMLMRMANAPDQAHSTADLAEDLQLSRHHLAKIMQRLAQAGIVETRRGGRGGAVLAKPPAEIRLGMLVDLLEDRQPIVECFSEKNGCTLDGCCALKVRMKRAEAAFLDELDHSTLADIVLRP